MSSTFTGKISLSSNANINLLSQFHESRGEISHLSSVEHQGFTIGGPALLAFFEWIQTSAEANRLDHVIFGEENLFRIYDYYLNIKKEYGGNNYNFKSSCIEYNKYKSFIAGLTEENFSDNAGYFIDRMHSESLEEIFGDMGITMPASYALKEFGLSKGSFSSPSELQKAEAFLQAWRSKIIENARNERRHLLENFLSIGIQEGQRVGLVDFGPIGSFLNEIEIFKRGRLDIELFGYSFLLNDSPLAKKRASHLRMSGLLDRENLNPEDIRILEKTIQYIEKVLKYHESKGGLSSGSIYNAESIRSFEEGVNYFIESYVGKYKFRPTNRNISDFTAPLIDFAFGKQ